MDTIGKKLFINEAMVGTLVSESVKLQNMLQLCIHAAWTGTPTGDLILEVSGESTPANWEALSTVNIIGAAGSQLWLDRNAPYLWARVRYVASGGAGNLTISSVTKGDQ